MTIAHCPKCREQVTIPGGASRQARVRCPLCSEEYLLDEALKPLPPLLLVINDPGATVGAPPANAAFPNAPFQNAPFPGAARSPFPPTESPAFVGIGDESESAVTLDEPEMFDLAPTAAVAATPAFQFEPGSASTAPRTSASKSASRGRSRKKQGSPLRMMVQTIGGGVMGLVIAQLILWWMPGKWNVSNRDPFGLAEKVAPYAPFLVPATLRGATPVAQANAPAEPFSFGEPARGDTSQAPASQNPPSQNPATNDAPGGGSAPLDSEIPNFTFNADAPEPATKRPTGKGPGPAKGKKPPAATEPEEEPQTKIEGEPAATKPDDSGDDLKNRPAENDAEMKKPMADPFDIPDVSLDASPSKDNDKGKPEPATKPGMKNPPMLSEADVAARTAVLVSANVAWDTAQNPTNEEKVELITQIYNHLALLGDSLAVVGVDAVSDETRQPVLDLVKVLVADPVKVGAVGKLGARRLAENPTEGVALYGVVVGHEKRGGWFATQLKPNLGDSVVTVISPTSLAELLPANSKTLVVGRVIPDAAAELSAYEGNEKQVVLLGLHAAGN